MNKNLSLLLLFIFITTAVLAQNKSDIEILSEWMSGSFNSEEQSLNDSSYYNISLEMTRIWNQPNDGYWLYVEQAVADTKDKPYRQRIYHLVEENGIIKSIIYSIPDEKDFVGGWKNPSVFKSLKPAQLKIREGCEVVINRKDENIFIGSTVDDNCVSNLRGATYATTKVVITKNSMISWDQGFTDKGEQVWGAVKGGYVFKKVIN
ncbi:MAG: chromophore lyase CpcT/CpeT [Ignavibacteriaceae bacterium]|nr:chromophore lyase CpcT/CpeT [Ignavibacteriaceae bacterium]